MGHRGEVREQMNFVRPKMLSIMERLARHGEPEEFIITRTALAVGCVLTGLSGLMSTVYGIVQKNMWFIVIGLILLACSVVNGLGAVTRRTTLFGLLSVILSNTVCIISIVITGGVIDGSVGVFVIYCANLRFNKSMGLQGTASGGTYSLKMGAADMLIVTTLTVVSTMGYNATPRIVVPRWFDCTLVISACVFDFFLFHMIGYIHKSHRAKIIAVSNARLQFLSKTSHEVRTPLNGVLGCLSVLKHSCGLSNEHLDLVMTAEESGMHLMTVLNDILDIAKIDSSKMELRNDKLNVVDELYMVVHNGYLSAQKKGLEVTFFAHRSVPKEMFGDALRFRQIFINLIQNAVKFTDKGHVHVEVSCGSHLLMPVSSTTSTSTLREQEIQERRMLLIEVSDTGKGISRTDLTKVFDRFSPANKTTFSEFGGTGLGLNLARELVVMMGGKIEAASEGVGKGASFTVELPVGRDNNESYLEGNINDESCFVWLYITSETKWKDSLRKYFNDWGVGFSCSTSVPKYNGPMVVLTHESCFFDVYQALESIDVPQLKRVGVLTTTASIDVSLITLNYAVEKLILPLKPGILRTFIRTECPTNTHELSLSIKPFPDLHELLVLIVDDLTINRKVLRITLAKCGILRCDEAVNGLEAVAKAKSTNYDIIFMDLEMPELDGREATQEIREYEASRDCPHSLIVGCTADAFPDTKIECLKSGFADFIVKPISVDLLRDTLTRIVSKHGLHEFRTYPSRSE